LVFKGDAVINCSNTMDTLVFAGTRSYRLASGSTQTVDSLFSAISTCAYMNIYSSSSGTAATISCPKTGNINASYINMQDIHGTGGATVVATKTNTPGNCTGWKITSAGHIQYYWVGGT